MKKALLKSFQILVILNLFFATGCKKDIPVTGVALNEDNITVSVGKTAKLTATVRPSDATNQGVSWTSSNQDIATVFDGVITAKEEGTVTITVITDEGKHPATCTVTVTEGLGILINGVRWATSNVDMPGTFAANPEDAGMFYQWNRKIGWSSTDPMINSNGGTTWNSSIPEGDNWIKANDPCPTGWRVPTLEELQSLVSTGSEWTTLNGVNGRYFGSGEQTVFFPAAGRRSHSDGTLGGVGFGLYWSGTPSPEESSACRMYFLSGDVTTDNNGDRCYGFSVRCVKDDNVGINEVSDDSAVSISSETSFIPTLSSLTHRTEKP